MEIINKGVRSKNAFTVIIGNTQIKNVVVPCSIKTQQRIHLLAKKAINKCGIRPMITYYPIPQEIGRKKEIVPFYMLCLAQCREEKLKLRGDNK